MAAHAEDPGTGALRRGADRGEPFGTPSDDVGKVGQGFDIVHHRWFAVETVCRRERGLDARQAAFALKRLQQCRFFSTDIGAGASVYPHMGGKSRAQDIRTDIAGGPGFGNRLF